MKKQAVKNSYPVVLQRCGSDYVVYIPDFDVNTEGKNLTDAIEMARDAIAMVGISWQDLGRSLPTPTEASEVKVKDGELVSLVDVDFDAYRRKHEMKSVRRNVSLPAWLNERAEAAGINVSAVLQKALQTELGIN